MKNKSPQTNNLPALFFLEKDFGGDRGVRPDEAEMACCSLGAILVLLLGTKTIFKAASINAVEWEDIEMINTL